MGNKKKETKTMSLEDSLKRFNYNKNFTIEGYGVITLSRSGKPLETGRDYEKYVINFERFHEIDSRIRYLIVEAGKNFNRLPTEKINEINKYYDANIECRLPMLRVEHDGTFGNSRYELFLLLDHLFIGKNHNTYFTMSKEGRRLLDEGYLTITHERENGPTTKTLTIETTKKGIDFFKENKNLLGI